MTRWAWRRPSMQRLPIRSKHLGVYPVRPFHCSCTTNVPSTGSLSRGTATITLGERVQAYKAGEHVHIPVGTVHRIANETGEALEFIEVQMGSYLGEDDIVRLEDRHQRTRPALIDKSAHRRHLNLLFPISEPHD